MQGKIKYYSPERGFGFIVCNDREDELFFHITDVIDYRLYEQDIQEGIVVTFEVDRNEKGLIAKSIQIEMRY